MCHNKGDSDLRNPRTESMEQSGCELTLILLRYIQLSYNLLPKQEHIWESNGAQLVIMMTPCEANLPHSPSIMYLFSVSLCPHTLASSAEFGLNMDPGNLFSPVFPCDFASAVTANPVRSLGFWDFIMHMDRLGVLLKCRFWSSRFGVRPDIQCF